MPRSPLSSPSSRHEPAFGFRVWRLKETRAMPSAHTHADIEVNFVVAGDFSYLHGGRIVRVEPLRFTVLWGGVPHRTVGSAHINEGIWMTLPLEWFLRWPLPGKFVARLFGGEIVSGPAEPLDRPLLERWLCDFQAGQPGRRKALLLEVEARFHRLAAAAVARPPRVAPGGSGLRQVERITDYIAAHYREPLTIGTIALAVNLHGKYLMRLFKRHSRMSVWEYVTRMRLAEAQRLLLTGDMKVIDVALESGFGSGGAFYRAFAAYAPGRKSPLDYRRYGTVAAFGRKT